MANAYGIETKFGESNFVTSDNIILKVVSDIAAEYLVQSISFRFDRPLNRIYEIGSPNVYFSPTRPIGSIQLSRIFGKYPITAILGTTGTGIWKTSGVANDHTIMLFKKGGTGYYNLSYVFTGAVIESYSGATDANGLLFSEQASIQFANLSF